MDRYIDDYYTLEGYMSRRHFSKNLKKNYKKTYSLSCRYDDGKVWTDSLLVTFLTGNNSTISNLISSAPGSRGKILTSTNFKNTLTQQEFTPDFHPQTIIDEEIEIYARTNPGKEITEETLLSIELELALDTMEAQYTSLYSYLDQAVGKS
jgi:uncharacterized membrane protein YcgQ (UPF0703/DUF1980 family)